MSFNSANNNCACALFGKAFLMHAQSAELAQSSRKHAHNNLLFSSTAIIDRIERWQSLNRA
jgi:hypothetical protein